MDDREITNIVHAGVVFAVYMFVMVSVYFLLSGPIDAIMNGITTGSLGDASDEMAQHSPDIEQAIKVAFAIGIATPATWFVMWVFSKEPFVGYKRRY